MRLVEGRWHDILAFLAIARDYYMLISRPHAFRAAFFAI
jgi:hypothetical protein